MSRSLLAVLWIVAAAGASAQTLHVFEGAVRHDEFGHAVAGAGDVNGDGRDDLIVGAPRAGTNGAASGSAYVFSGLDGSLLYVFHGSFTDRLGDAVDGAGDVDMDGFDDIVVGAPFDDHAGQDAGRVFVYSGSDGMVIHTFVGGPGDALGVSVAGAGDVDGDGHDDVIAGANRANGGRGRAIVYSGATGAVLHTFEGDDPGDSLGTSVDGAGDADGDGIGDLVVGAPHDDDNGMSSGSARVYSGFDGLVLHAIIGDAAGDELGVSVAGAGDVDGDGHDDVVVGAHGHDGGASDAGQVRVVSGFDGTTIHSFLGHDASDLLGSSVSGAGDVDGDGHDDVLGGARLDDDNGINTGSVALYSGATGVEQVRATGANTARGQFGFSVSGAGDVDGNGRLDVIAGEPHGRDGNLSENGRARVYEAVIATRYPGSNEDFFLFAGVGLGGLSDATAELNQKTASAGDVLLAHLVSPRGVFRPFPPLLIGQFFATGSPPASPAAFPEVHVDPTSPSLPPFLIFDGTSGPLGPQGLPEDGIFLSLGIVPAGLGGTSLMLQALSLAFIARNMIFAATDGHEIQLVP